MKLNYLNYKEPLTPVEEGFGYMGTLAQSEDRNHVQCHVCGRMFENLGQHVWQAHNIKSKEYRAKFKLGFRTPLCSDKFSEKYRAMKTHLWETMSEEKKEKRRQQMREAREKTIRVGNPNTLEKLNRVGMCPDQLIDHIQKLAQKLDTSPTFEQFKTEYNGKYVGAIIRTFGSWNGAKRMANLKVCKSGAKIPHNKSSYTNEELLEFLKSAYKEKNKIPTHSDWRKGFLPSYNLYRHRFGGIQKARKAAGLPV